MLTTIVLAALLQVPSPAQELAPGIQYDPAIPTLTEIVGHDFREEITPPEASELPSVYRVHDASIHERCPARAGEVSVD